MKKITGKIYLLCAFALAGTSVVTGYVLSGKLSRFTITAVSLGIMILCLSPFYGAKTVQTIRLLKRSDWKLLVLQAVFGIFLFRLFLLLGVNLTSTIEAGILTGTTPAITSILAFLVLREKPTGWTALGIACTVSGIVLLQSTSLYSIELRAQHFWGNVFMLCAAASESAFNIISRKHKTMKQNHTEVQIHPVVQTLIVSAIAFALSLVPALAEQPFAAIRTIGPAEWAALIWYGLIVTALAFVFFYAGVKRCDAYTTAAFSGMIPLTSMFLSILLLRETIGLWQWAGGFLIVSSMLMIGNNRWQSHQKITSKRCKLQEDIMFSIDSSIRASYPEAKIGILVMREVFYSSTCDESEMATVIDDLHQKYGHLDRKALKELHPIGAYVAYYKKFGSSYHLLSQLESVLKGKKSVHFESGLLQAMFLSEIDGMLLTAGHDLSKLQLPLNLKSANGTEVYQSISCREITAVQGDIMLCDQSGIISSILRGPDYRSRIAESTTEVLFSIYAPPGIEADYIEKNLRNLEKRIRSFSPSAKTELLQIFS